MRYILIIGYPNGSDEYVGMFPSRERAEAWGDAHLGANGDHEHHKKANIWFAKPLTPVRPDALAQRPRTRLGRSTLEARKCAPPFMEATMFEQEFMRGLDIQQPDWWIRHADQTDLQDFVRFVNTETRQGESLVDSAKQRLRRQTAERLMLAVRAAVNVQLVGTLD